MIPLPPYEPDKTIFDPVASTVVSNVIPVANGWGPAPALVVASDPLPSPGRGAVSVRTISGDYTLIVGDGTALYKYNKTPQTFTDISGPSAPYLVPTTDRWSFARFGDVLIATARGDLTSQIPQVYDVEAGGDFADMGGDPPEAKYVAVVGDFVVLANLTGYPSRLQWSGINDYEFWTVGEKASDFQTFPDGEDITGIFADAQSAVIFQRKMIRMMQFDPASGFVFRFSILNPKRGCVAPLSIVQIGPQDFVYLAEDGFCRGVNGTPIGAERVDRTFFASVSGADRNYVRGAMDPVEKIVWWVYPLTESTVGAIGYDWQLDRWVPSSDAITDFVSVATSGYTLDDMDVFGELEDQPDYPLDSWFWRGGQPLFGAFTDDNELAFYTGANKEATIETADILSMPDGRRSFVSPIGARVLTDATTFTLAAGASAFHGGTRTWTANIAPNSRTKLVPMRSAGLLHRFRLIIPAGTTWRHASAVEQNAIPEGGQ